MDAVILVGGRGSRLTSIGANVPKPLAPVGGRPFLDHLLSMLVTARSVSRIHLAAGYLADQVSDYVAGLTLPVPIAVVTETEPLGTGGALRNMLPIIVGDRFLVINGDSIARWPIDGLVRQHAADGCLGTLLALEVAETGRYGQLVVDRKRVTAFSEKVTSTGRGLVNGGIYCLERPAFDGVEAKHFSLETEFLPRLAASNELGFFRYDGPFIDIGTPQSYAMAQVQVPEISGLRTFCRQ